jgi:hypothetical protein
MLKMEWCKYKYIQNVPHPEQNIKLTGGLRKYSGMPLQIYYIFYSQIVLVGVAVWVALE